MWTPDTISRKIKQIINKCRWICVDTIVKVVIVDR